jgi:hypothetical protein
MGNVDTIRKVLQKDMAVRGPNSGPGSLMWYGLFDYVLYLTFKIFQYKQLEARLDKFCTFVK